MKRTYKKLSLNQRLMSISAVVFLPMAFLILYLIYNLNQTINAYDEVTRSVTYANEYVNNFKQRMDYSMYLAVIAGKSMEELEESEMTNGIQPVNPYKYMKEMQDACLMMEEYATVEYNKIKCRRISKSIDNMRKCVAEIENNIQTNEMYDQNVILLDQNIYTFTTVIQDGIQEYIYEETQNFAQVKNELSENKKQVVKISVLVSLLIGLLSLALSVFASNRVTKPIKKLCDMTRKVAKGDFSARTENAFSDDEISVLTASFNNMTEQIGNLVEDIKIEQSNLRITETKLLQAQINPHFLYNTLDTIVWLAEENQTKEVVSMVTSLSQFFRTTLSKGNDWVSVEEEVNHIKSYLEIQQFRYQDIMDYDIQIEKSIYHYRIPKLTLQPLIENALYHGIKNKRGKGLIQIKGYEEGGKLLFRIIDNGIGMEPEKLDELRKNMAGMLEAASGFGLSNVNQRIQHYYGEEYGVFFESEKGKGTEATVILEAKNIEKSTADKI